MDNRKEQNFEVPDVDNTPMGQIGMMGRFYRGMGERQIRSPIAKIFGTLFALAFLVLPGCLWVYMVITDRWSEVDGVPWLAIVGYAFLGTILLLVGVKIIYNLNFRNRK